MYRTRFKSLAVLSVPLLWAALGLLASAGAASADGIITSGIGTAGFTPNDYAAMPGIDAWHQGGLAFTSIQGLNVTLSQPGGRGYLSVPGANGFGWPAGQELYDNQYSGIATYLFDEDIYGMGLWAESATGGGITQYLDLYKRDGTLIATEAYNASVAAPANFDWFTDSKAEVASVRVTMYGGPSSNYMYLGNLSLVTPAPEPRTGGICGAMLLLLGVSRRFRLR